MQDMDAEIPFSLYEDSNEQGDHWVNPCSIMKIDLPERNNI